MPTSPGAISPVPCPNTCAIHCLISLSDISEIVIWCIWYLYLIYLYLYLISGNNPGDDDESHRNNPRLIEGYPDFHSVPKLFKADPGMIHLLILTVGQQSRIFCWIWQDLAYSSNQSAEEEFSQPPWSCNAWFRHNLSTANSPPNFCLRKQKYVRHSLDLSWDLFWTWTQNLYLREVPVVKCNCWFNSCFCSQKGAVWILYQPLIIIITIDHWPS